jgi:hypothetical protein
MDGARAYCEQHPEVGAVLLPEQNAEPVILGRALSEVEVDRVTEH